MSSVCSSILMQAECRSDGTPPRRFSSSIAATSKRRWFQFSLRTLLLVMMLSSALLAWIGNFRYCMSRANRHEAEENALTLAGHMSVRSPGTVDTRQDAEMNLQYF